MYKNTQVNMIAIIDRNYGIGVNNKLLTSVKSDMLKFRTTTINQIVVMGRKTFESIGSKGLPQRINIIISTNLADPKLPNVLIARNIDDAMFLAKMASVTNSACYDKKIFIIGGARLYNAMITYADHLYITHMNREYSEADTFFPAFKPNFRALSHTILEEGITFTKYLRMNG